MNQKNIYTILFIVSIIVSAVGYHVIKTELTETKKTPQNTKSQPCPDYWTYEISTNTCLNWISFNAVQIDCDEPNCTQYSFGDYNDPSKNFSDWNFCEKQKYAFDRNIPWNGISNIYNPRCLSNKVYNNSSVIRQIGEPESTNMEYYYIHYIFFYSLMLFVVILLEYVFGQRGLLILMFFGFMLFDYILHYFLGFDVQLLLFGNRYTDVAKPGIDESNVKNPSKCYNWDCF